MPEKLFTGECAAEVLRQEGLLADVHLPAGGGGFLGAGLDNRRLLKDELFVALAGEHVDGRRFAPAALAAGHWVLTRPFDKAGPDDLSSVHSSAGILFSPDPEAALAALGAAWRKGFDLPVVGITGTNGKTTTKDFVTALLAAAGPTWATVGNLNNRLGLPLTLLGLRARHRFAVVEMGASAVGHIAHLAGLARPTLAVITNACEAHLAEFGSLDGVITGKGEILDALPTQGRAVLNTDSPGYEIWAERAGCPVVSFGQTEGDYLWSWRPIGPGGGPEISLNGESWPVPLPGAHNGANLAAAITVAYTLGLSETQIRNGLAAFRPSEHRSRVLELGGRTILDDAYNANPASMAAAAGAVAQLPGNGRVVAVLGHMAELGTDSDELHRGLGKHLAGGRLDVLLVVGEKAEPMAQGFASSGRPTVFCANIAAAAAWLLDHSGAGDRILIKGSRSAGMEQIIPLLEEAWGAKEGTE